MAICFTSSRLTIRPLGVLLLALSYDGGSFKSFSLPREQWREMSAWISERATPESVIIVRPGHLRSEIATIQDLSEQKAWMAIATYYGLGSPVPTALFSPSCRSCQGDWPAEMPTKKSPSVFLLCRNLPTHCDEIVSDSFAVSGYQLSGAKRSRWVSAFQWVRSTDTEVIQ